MSSFVVSGVDNVKFTARYPDKENKAKFYTVDSLNRAANNENANYGEGSGLFAYSTYFRKRILEEFGLKVTVEKGYK